MKRIALFLIISILFSACGAAAPAETTAPPPETTASAQTAVPSLPPETTVAETTVPEETVPETTAALEAAVTETGEAVIDYTYRSRGYVTVTYLQENQRRLKVQVKGPHTTYTYDLTPTVSATFPLSDGDGSYKVVIYENISGTKYAAVMSTGFEVALENEFAPFLRSNQYVNYTAQSAAAKKAKELTSHLTDPLEKVAAVYDFVVDELTYDKEKAATVTSGYLPEVDKVLEEKTGICFDYAALMAAMLRSQGIPCKLVVGYAGTAYHAWINVWTEEHGWVDGAIFFDGERWRRMDPTFASTGHRSDDIMDFINNSKNYREKYLY